MLRLKLSRTLPSGAPTPLGQLSILMIATGGLCGPGSADDDKTARPAHSASAVLGSSSAATSARPGASSSAVATTPASKLAGSWSGEFESKKAQVSLDPGVKDKAWAADDGREASGKGSLELAVDKDGTVTGRVTGALGPGSLSGVVEEDQRVSVSLTPAAPEAAPAMSGTLVLAPSSDGSELTGTLRASSGSSVVVREAAIKLRRRPDGG